MSKRNYYIVFVLAFMTLCNESRSQHVSFEKLVHENQSFGFIVDVVQDTQGYIWFATVTGLYRYDGHTSKLYAHDSANQIASLAGSFVNAIHADPDGGLWLSIYPKGFYYFNTVTEEFTAYRRNSNSSNTLSSDSVLSLLIDRSGMLWIGTENGLNRYDRKSETYTNYYHREDDPGSLSHPVASTIYEDSSGTLWVGTGFDYDKFIDIKGAMPPGGLNKFDSSTGKFKRILYQPGVSNGLHHNIITSILDDGNGTLWIGTIGDGLHSLSLHNDSITHHAYSSEHPESLSAPYSDVKMYVEGVSGIIRDDTGCIWISTFNAGISRWNPVTRVLTRYDDAFSDNPIDRGIWNIFKSKDGIIWLTTEATNVYRLNPTADNIERYAKSFSINSFAEDRNKHLWIATSTGLLEVDSTHVVLQRYSEGNYHGSVTVSRNGKIWYGSRNVLECYDPQTKSIKKFTKTVESESGYRGGNPTHIMEDRDGDIWIASPKSLQRLNPITEAASQYTLVEVDTAGQSWSWWRSKHILEDKEGYLWVSTSNGIICLDKETNKTKQYLSGYKVTMSFLDHRNTLWVGTYDGLFYKEEESDSFVEYRSDLFEFSRSAIISILEDDSHHLWVASFLGLIQLDQSRKNLIKYSNSSGVDAFNLNMLSSFKSSNGAIYFGGQYGYISFNPDDLNQNKTLPELRISEFRINEKPLLMVYPLMNDSLDDGKLIALNYNENTLSIAISLLHYVNIGRHELYYYLQNYDKEWRRAGPDRMAFYYQLPPGEYTFLVKGSAGNGLWVERSLGIVISPPWWKTGWAYSFYILITLLSVWSIVKWRTRALNREKETLEQRVIQRTDELRKEKEIAEATLQELKATQKQLIQSEKMASLGELTAGIAHEIQNPLNFVNNFSEVSNELLDEMNEELSKGEIEEAKTIASDVKQNLEKILHHGKRADGIVKGMLQHSRSSSGIRESTDINALADEYLRLAYHGLRAKDKSFNATMKTDFDESIGNINIIPQDIGRVILNLITNAFYVVAEKKKQNPEGYEPTVIVSSRKVDGKVELSVKDNGLGIPNHIKEKIFQPFFTTKPTGQGTGLGLSLSYDIVKAHGGELKVETVYMEGLPADLSVLNEVKAEASAQAGSEFIIQLPIV